MLASPPCCWSCARPDDHALYLAAFDRGHECLRLLRPYAPDIAATIALSAPISTGDVTAARLLLEAGADPNRVLEAGLLGEPYEQEPGRPGHRSRPARLNT